MALNRAHELMTREIGTGVSLRNLLAETVALTPTRRARGLASRGLICGWAPR
jgi:hypothetical protein